MKKIFSHHYPFLILLAFLSFYHLGTLHLIPFHPDESTQIYMSQDFEHMLTDPFDMAWEPEDEVSREMRLRQLDAPLTKYLIGLGRSFSGQKPLPKDWRWDLSWTANAKNGALPSDKLLHAARWSTTLLLPITLTLFYTTLIKLDGSFAGLFGTFMLGANALVLIHARRAMAEGAILLGVTAFLWSLHYRRTQPWLVGLAVAVAYNAKQSTLPLLPVGIIAVSWMPKPAQNLSKLIKNLALCLGSFLLLTYILNPLLWNHPWGALLARWQARFAFTRNQISTINNLTPNQVLDSYPQRLLSLLNNLYLNQPSVADVGNYLDHTREASKAYFQIPGSAFGRGLIAGGIFLTLTLGGILFSIFETVQDNSPDLEQLSLVFLATLGQSTALLLFVPLPWQRYVIPLLPFSIFWLTRGVLPLLRPLSGAPDPSNANDDEKADS